MSTRSKVVAPKKLMLHKERKERDRERASKKESEEQREGVRKKEKDRERE